MELVSVVIPTFNRANYILEAVTSVLNQTYPHFEVLVVDDGSTDNTVERINQLNDVRVRLVKQAHRGVSAALNLGCRSARGDLIGRLDSDDIWLPGFLTETVARLDANPRAALAYAPAQLMDQDGKLMPEYLGVAPRFPDDHLASLLYGDCVTPMAVVIRRLCLVQVGGYNESYNGTEDWDLWIRLAENRKFEFVNQVLAHYRVHSQNLTRSGSEQFARLMRDRVRILDTFYARPDAPPNALAIQSIAYRNLYQDIALRHVSAGHWREAAVFSWRALQVAPDKLSALWRGMRNFVYYSLLGKTRLGFWLRAKWLKRSGANRK